MWVKLLKYRRYANGKIVIRNTKLFDEKEVQDFIDSANWDGEEPLSAEQLVNAIITSSEAYSTWNDDTGELLGTLLVLSNTMHAHVALLKVSSAYAGKDVNKKLLNKFKRRYKGHVKTYCKNIMCE